MKRLSLFMLGCAVIISFNLVVGIYHRLLHIEITFSLYLTVVTIVVLTAAGMHFCLKRQRPTSDPSQSPNEVQ